MWVGVRLRLLVVLRDKGRLIFRWLVDDSLLICRFRTFDNNLSLYTFLEEFTLLSFKPNNSRSLLFNFIVFFFDLAVGFL